MFWQTKRGVVTATEKNNESGILRNSLHPENLSTSPDPSLATVYDILKLQIKNIPSRNILGFFILLLGQRPVLNIVKEQKLVTKVVAGVESSETKTWNYFELGAYEWMTFKDVETFTNEFGSALRASGFSNEDKLTLFAETSRDWMLTALSCITQSVTITTAYATLGEEGLLHSLKECSSKALFTNAELLPMTLQILKTISSLEVIIYNGKPDAEIVEKFKQHKNVKLFSVEEFRVLGKANKFDHVPPKKDDVACIMYTSGSTGPPKGVMLTHANILAAVSGARNVLKKGMNSADTSNDSYLAFLPLAHILEFTAEMTWLYMGVAIGYGSVKTLTDTSVRNCKGDIKQLAPTVLAGVPAVWEGIRKAVLSKLNDASPIQRKIFNAALDLKWYFMQKGWTSLSYPLDVIVFNKIKDQVGGRVKFALSGGAPIPHTTQQFMSVCCMPLINGYGMTECCAVLAVQEPDQAGTLGIVGPPVTNVEVKLVDCESTGYKASNKPKPQGELWVRGPSVMKGYYKQEVLTKEAITEDGWLMTGDIAEFNDDGTLSIIDRKKNLVKLSNGEYIALEKLEAIYKSSKLIQNICVYADSEQSFCVALIAPIEKEVVAIAKSLNLFPDSNVESLDLPTICAKKEIRDEVLKNLKAIAKDNGFKPAEILGQVWVTGEEWTPQSGLLTAAMKLQRKAIATKYKQEILKMYGK